MNNITMTTDDHLAVGRRLYETFARGDVPGLIDLLHPDVVLDVPGSNPLAGRWSGIDEVLGFLATARSLATETIEVLDLLAGERHVAALCMVRGDRQGRPALENRTVHLHEIGADGRVVSIRFHNADQGVVDAFWG